MDTYRTYGTGSEERKKLTQTTDRIILYDNTTSTVP